MFDPDTNLMGLRTFQPVYDPATLTLAATAASAGTAVYTASKAGKGPALQPTVPMPDPNDPAALEARRKKLADLEATKGRESTILDNSAPTYVNSELGL